MSRLFPRSRSERSKSNPASNLCITLRLNASLGPALDSGLWFLLYVLRTMCTLIIDLLGDLMGVIKTLAFQNRHR